MTINYKLIADNDPGGTLEEAFTIMSVETESVSRGLFKVNDIMIVAVLGAANGHAFLDAVEASELVPERAKLWLRGEGININHPDTAVILTTINPPHLDDVLTMGNEYILKYGDKFNEGHLQSARELRADGKV